MYSISPQQLEDQFRQLFQSWCGQAADLVLPLAPSGSKRVYYRIKSKDFEAIGAYNADAKENKAFLTFSQHFYEKGMPVPQIYATNLEENIYLQEDLGFTTLYSYLLQKGDDFPNHLIKLYQKVLHQLAHLQVEGGKDLDYSNCHSKASFDKQSMLWDLNYFKYYFLKLGYISFDEEALEQDFHTLADYLLTADTNYFMFRDFQTRNIMIKNGQPYFIDYQGGRKGAVQYDVASLLFQAKANIPPQLRAQLLDNYLDSLEQLIKVNRNEFKNYYNGYVLIRLIQVLGAYGFRGLYERKQHFLQSIPFALNNIKWYLSNIKLPIELPELYHCLNAVTEAPQFQKFDRSLGEQSILTVRIKSFSYKKGIPEDVSGNGGGHVFDCRFIHNPGRYEPYKQLTGRDESVINFLQQHSKMNTFVNNVFHIVDKAVENYIERSFTSLSINFGCTGGQHRSVYAADQVAKHIYEKYGVRVLLQHRERGWAEEELS